MRVTGYARLSRGRRPREMQRKEGVPWGWMKRRGEGERAAGVGARVGFDQYLAPTPHHHTTTLRSGTPCPHQNPITRPP